MFGFDIVAGGVGKPSAFWLWQFDVRFGVDWEELTVLYKILGHWQTTLGGRVSNSHIVTSKAI